MRKLLFLFIPLVLLLILGGGVLFFYMYKASATVTLFVKPNLVTQDQDVTFSSSDSSDFSKGLIAAKAVSGSVDGNLSADATGTKQVGDKAKGTVTIYNSSTDGNAQLSAGSTIKSSNGLSFTLDKDVAIASASGDIFSGTKPGTMDVSVTAGDIGTDYNLPSATTFTVSGNSNLAGKNGSAFSGGTKKNVTVVSKDDLAKLKTNLIKSLQDKVGSELTKQANSGETILPVVLSTSIDQAKFDKNVGDQAKSVQLSASVTFNGLSYQNDDLTSMAKTVLKDQHASDVTFQNNSITSTLKNPQKKTDITIGATVHISAGLLPKINTDDTARQLSGQTLQKASDIISHLPQVDRHEIAYSPQLFFFFSKLLPQLPKHVTVVVQSNE